MKSYSQFIQEKAENTETELIEALNNPGHYVDTVKNDEEFVALFRYNGGDIYTYEAEKNNKGQWMINFYDSNDEQGVTGKVGPKGAMKILATVKKITVDFINEYSPKDPDFTMYFASADVDEMYGGGEARSRIYKTMVKQTVKEVGGKWDTNISSDGEYTTFIIKKKK